MTNDITRKILFHIVNEHPSAMELGVEDLRKSLGRIGLWFDRKDIIRFFQRLESFDYGKLIAGRRGHQTRLRWAQPPSKNLFSKMLTDTNVSPIGGKTFEHRFQLRDGMEPVTLVLPRDLSAREANRLAQFITSLPLDAG